MDNGMRLQSGYMDFNYCHFDRNLSIMECVSPILSNMRYSEEYYMFGSPSLATNF